MIENNFTCNAIAVAETPFKQKFAIPRQSGLVPLAIGTLTLLPPYNCAQALANLDQCSHIWLQFIFHKNAASDGKTQVRPPRLGGNTKLGVFASRSSFRPNRIGLSVVKVIAVDCDRHQITVSGIDFLDGTPILDIKPYLPYVDCVQNASVSFAQSAPAQLIVQFSDKAQGDLVKASEGLTEDKYQLKSLISEVLQWDARPAYQELNPEREFKSRIYHFDLVWRYLKQDGVLKVEVLNLFNR